MPRTAECYGSNRIWRSGMYIAYGKRARTGCVCKAISTTTGKVGRNLSVLRDRHDHAFGAGRRVPWNRDLRERILNLSGKIGVC